MIDCFFSLQILFNSVTVFYTKQCVHIQAPIRGIICCISVLGLIVLILQLIYSALSVVIVASDHVNIACKIIYPYIYHITAQSSIYSLLLYILLTAQSVRHGNLVSGRVLVSHRLTIYTTYCTAQQQAKKQASLAECQGHQGRSMQASPGSKNQLQPVTAWPSRQLARMIIGLAEGSYHGKFPYILSR